MNLKEVSKWVNYINEEALKANKAFVDARRYAVTTRLWADSIEVAFWVGGKCEETMTAYFSTGGLLDAKALENFEAIEFKIAEFKMDCLNVKAC